jgi:DNA-binding response OmpR family regulator
VYFAPTIAEKSNVDRKPHILIAEDERLFQEFLARSLSDQGYDISCFEFGLEALNILDPKFHDLVLLDLRLPDEDGIVIARQIRARCDVPIVILTSDDEESTRINCLSIGVDDFMIKSVSPDELRLRIRNLLRRTLPNNIAVSQGNREIAINEWTLVSDDMSVRHANGREANLTLNEFRTLETLAKANGRILSRSQILDALSNSIDGPSERMVDAYISRIRQKLSDDAIITTVKGVGYKAAMNTLTG